jgi:hypothetical protein
MIGMEFGGEHAGVPGIATLLWENSSPSSGMAADTVITISTLQKYDLIGIVPIHNVSDNLAPNAMQLFSTENTSINNQLITANSGNANNYARTFTITNGTTITFSNGMQPGVAYNSNYVVPLRIYGFRFGNGGGGGSSGSGYSETFTGVLNGKIKARTEGTYTIVIPAKTSKITDGSYQAIVTIKDETGRTTIRNTTFTIDNTPPVIVLQRPGTDINATLSNADTYGHHDSQHWRDF